MPADHPPRRGYAICSEHRSGSTLLCRLLTSTGKLGHPEEYFRDSRLCVRIERNPALLDEIVGEASTANGIYGLKVFTQQFDVTARARWTDRLPGLHFVHLDRRDLLGQAISLVRALQTGQYFPHEPRRGEPRYDRKEIARQLARSAAGQMRWRRYFARNGIEPLWLIHEEVVARPQMAADAVAAHVGLLEPVPIDRAQADCGRMRDEQSDEWRARFIGEMQDRSFLDHRLGRPRIWLRRLARDLWYLTRGRSSE
ncbi:MAG: Stf0 family sulfotransferase [Sphingosinicella sp.]